MTSQPGMDVFTAWGQDLQPAVCERCHWRYLTPREALADAKGAPLCPHCFQARMTALPDENLREGNIPYLPELIAPFEVSEAGLQTAIASFRQGIPYAPPDLTFDHLRARLNPIFLPLWLVDGQVQALWKAEVGFDYQVVSHQEEYSDRAAGAGQWKTREVKESRIRWEPRIGRANRSYQNVNAPAMEESAALRTRLGDFDLSKSVAYQPAHPIRAWVRLPDRSTHDAWTEAAAAFQCELTEDCQKAAAANHVRQFQWQAQFDHLNWTLLLLPAYTTFYYDDDHCPQSVMIHGQNGAVTGQRRASMRRAQRAAFILFLIGLAIALIGLAVGVAAMYSSDLTAIAAIAFLIGLPLMVSALAPLTVAWNFNRRKE